jgi:hypothetical protein
MSTMSEMATEGMPRSDNWLMKQCEYETLDLPCKVCKRRNLQCGRDEKVLGPKARVRESSDSQPEQSPGTLQLVTPLSPINVSDEPAVPSDFLFLEVVSRRKSYHALVPQSPSFRPSPIWLWINSLRSRGLHTHTYMLRIPWPNFTLSSKSFRYAALALWASYYYSPDSVLLLEYLDKFYKYIKQAFEAKSIMEVLVASYAVFICCFQTNEPLDTLFERFKGICTAASRLLRETPNAANDPSAVITVNSALLGSLEVFRLAYSARDPNAIEEIDLLRDVHSTLQETSHWLCTHFRPGKTLSTELDFYGQLMGLDYYFRFYLDHYLALTQSTSLGNVEEISEVAASLQQIICHITGFVPKMTKPPRLLDKAKSDSGDWPWLSHRSSPDHDIVPNTVDFESSHSALLYALALLIQQLLDSSGAHATNDSDISAASLLCRLCALAPSQCGHHWLPSCPMGRYLFWAGLQLSRSVQSKGTPPRTIPALIFQL